MLENVGRKITLILVLVLTSIALLVVPETPFNLGLDIKGGLRLVYRLDFEGALQSGQITAADMQNQAALLAETVGIIQERVDPTGVIDAIVRGEGTDRMVVELPGITGTAGEGAVSALAADLDESATSLELAAADAAALAGFPQDGGRIVLGNERIHYGRRLGAALHNLARAQGGSKAAPHPAGTAVQIDARDPILESIESLGDLSFQIVAEAGDFDSQETDITKETEKLREWAAKNPGVPIAAFNRLSPAEGGPHPSIEWYPEALPDKARDIAEVDRSVPILRPRQLSWSFRGSDLLRVTPSSDNQGFPAVGFEFQDARKNDFLEFTEENTGRLMAIVLNGEMDSAPRIDEPLPGQGIIRGQFSPEQRDALIRVLHSGSLRIRPELENKELVGPTLGRDYVDRGVLAGILAVILVLGFMIAYYRRLGVWAAISMLLGFTMLMGALSFLNATLTLPGVAGLILTVGMAVDSNILIFDRIREEKDKGRNPRQAAKTGFERALSAILDSNITTFLTAIILYKVGTGPVRGFAVTLMVGILASVFAAVVVTRVFVHFDLVRGIKEHKMGRWMVTANYDFLSKWRYAVTGSLVLIAAGLALFIALPNREKLGIQFLGGAEVRVRCARPMATQELRDLVATAEGYVRDAEVKAVIESEVENGRYTDFSLVFKVGESEEEAEVGTSGNRESQFEQLVTELLKDVLLPDGVLLDYDPASGATNLTLSFSEDHPADDIQHILGEAAGIRDSRVVPIPDQPFAYQVAGSTAPNRDRAELLQAIRRAFQDPVDATGAAFRLATPITSSSSVGPQVVGELRDKALIALAFSLFVIVLYIRVRFAEYSYGFAAVLALIHDVLITLGVMTLLNLVGFLNGEITLTMIAVFLTIIGYSLNDTIVIFDRFRENLPRMKAPLREVLNISINQTLSRTIMTSFTTFLAVAVLYAFNVGTGNVLESFAFAMMVGVVTGTYSTIYIATPALIWFDAYFARRRARKSEELGRQPASTASAV
ncbi:MAG: protein translocase subunit SecD [Planctomycetota bacterium]